MVSLKRVTLSGFAAGIAFTAADMVSRKVGWEPSHEDARTGSLVDYVHSPKEFVGFGGVTTGVGRAWPIVGTFFKGFAVGTAISLVSDVGVSVAAR